MRLEHELPSFQICSERIIESSIITGLSSPRPPPLVTKSRQRSESRPAAALRLISRRPMEEHGGAAGFRRVLLLAFCVAGIWSACITQGVLQETVSTKRFGPDGKRFEHLSFLNLAQNVVCLVWSFIMLQLWSRKSAGGAPWWSYWSASITNTIGPAMGIEALKYISYPAQL